MPKMRFSKGSAVALGVAVLTGSLIFSGCQKVTVSDTEPSSAPSATGTPIVAIVEITFAPLDTEAVAEPTAIPTPVPTATPIPTEAPKPHAVAESDPKQWGYESALEVNGTETDEYRRAASVFFDDGKSYASIPGILTLRGSNHRTNSAYGTARIESGTLEKIWSVKTGSMEKSSSGHWSGSGWTGQCLMVQWPSETRQIMNLYDWAKAKDGLIEVIYATMDGNVYFIDAETGNPTRDKLEVGIPFKGAGALDPRGYPILYLGTGDSYKSSAKKGRAMAYSLIDFTRLLEIGVDRDDFALRNWHAYDSSVLVDAETDTLIVPGENGILYTVHMNTVYDAAAGTLSMSPDEVVKQRYDADRVAADRYGKFCYGYESSTVAWGEYLYLCDNGGFLRCIHANTMETVWVADLMDDVNSTPCLEDADGGTYLYVGNTVDKQAKGGKGTTTFFKINALTGERVWTYTSSVTTDDAITGGCMCSAILGEQSLKGLVITGFASTGGNNRGEIVALNTKTGEVVWAFELSTYTWSSPLALYTESGKGYVLCNDQKGTLYLLNGEDGTLVTTLKLSENIEASAAAFGEWIVIGTRDQHIFGIRVS